MQIESEILRLFSFLKEEDYRINADNYHILRKSISKLAADERTLIDALKEFYLQRKKDIRDSILVSEDISLGYELGIQYSNLQKFMITSLLTLETLFLSEQDAINGIEASLFGSSSRAEAIFYSDTDVFLAFNPDIVQREVAETIHEGLEKRMVAAGMHKPELVLIDMGEECREFLDNDYVAKYNLFHTDDFYGNGNIHTLIREKIDEPNLHRDKAYFTVIEQRMPRGWYTEEHDVFQIKWDRIGGLTNFMALRGIAHTIYDIHSESTLGILRELANHGAITNQEHKELENAFNYYMIVRNEMHIFAGDTAVRLGPRTRKYISSQLPWLGTSDEIRETLEMHRDNVNRIYLKLENNFFNYLGIDYTIFRQFHELPEAEQIRLASEKTEYAQMASFCSRSPEVLTALKDKTDDWVVLFGLTRNSYSSGVMLTELEPQTRKREFLFTRLNLALNPSLPIDILPEIIRNSDYKPAAAYMAKSRLAGLIQEYPAEFEPGFLKKCERLVFYPTDKYYEESPDPGSDISLFFASRLAPDKNFIEYLHILKQVQTSLSDKGIRVRGDVYGSIDKRMIREISSTITELGLEDYVVYHGSYTQENLIDGLRRTDRENSIFILPMGLIALEVMSMGFPTIVGKNVSVVSKHAAYPLSCCVVDYNPADLNDVVSKTAASATSIAQDREERLAMVSDSRKLIAKHYSMKRLNADLLNIINSTASPAPSVLFTTQGYSFSVSGIDQFWTSFFRSACEDNMLGDYTVHHINVRNQKDDKKLARYDLSFLIGEPYTYSESCPQSDESGTADCTAQFAADLTAFINVMYKLPIDPDKVYVPPDSELYSAAANALSGMWSFFQQGYGIHSSLATERVYEIFRTKFPDVTDDEIQTVLFDSKHAKGLPYHNQLKLENNLVLLVTDIPEATVSVGTSLSSSWWNIVAKEQYGTPFVFVEHSLANSHPSGLMHTLDDDFYTPFEKEFLQRFVALTAYMIHQGMDSYVALWPVNADRVRELVPESKIHLIEQAVDTNVFSYESA